MIINLTYPPNNYAKCIIPKSAIGQIEINCVIAYQFSGEPIFIEQQILRDDDLNELLTLKSVKSNEKINCVEGDMNEIFENTTIINEEISENISTEEKTTILDDEIFVNISTEENTTIINDEISENISTEENTTIINDEISENITTEENTTIINDEIFVNITTEENTTILEDEISENINTEENTTILDDEIFVNIRQKKIQQY